MKRLLLAFTFLLLAGNPTHAGNIKCGADTTGGGVINQINDCTAGTPFSYGGVTPASTAANSNLCPINLTNCGLRQWRCDADTAAKGNAAPVYSDQASCVTGCNWTAACSAAPFTKTLSGSGVGTICTDSDMTIVVRDAGGGTSYRLGMLDTSPGGAAHWNCEPNIVNQGGTFPQYTPPIVDGWHIINHPGDANDPVAGLDIDFSPYLPANSGTDGWNANVEFCVIPVWGPAGNVVDNNVDADGDGILESQAPIDGERCTHAIGSAMHFPYAWDPTAGAHAAPFIYRYRITLANNIYTCGINPTALCQGSAGGTSFNPQYYRVLKSGVATFSADLAYGSISSIQYVLLMTSTTGYYPASMCLQGICPTSGYVDVATQPPNTFYLGTWTIMGSTSYYDFYTPNSPTFNPSTSKTCMKAGTCNAEPVCSTGYGCNCTNGTTPSCPDNGTFDPAADNCQLSGAALCQQYGLTYDATAKGCVTVPDCGNNTFNLQSKLCEKTVSITCPDALYNYQPTSQLCQYLQSCPAATPTWDQTLSTCRSNTQICPAGDLYTIGLDVCSESSTGPPNTVLNTTSDKYEATPTYTCNPGDPLSGTTCTQTVTTTTTYSAFPPCDPGDTLSGTTCTKTTTTTSTYAATANSVSVSGIGWDANQIVYVQGIGNSVYFTHRAGGVDSITLSGCTASGTANGLVGYIWGLGNSIYFYSGYPAIGYTMIGSITLSGCTASGVADGKGRVDSFWTMFSTIYFQYGWGGWIGAITLSPSPAYSCLNGGTLSGTTCTKTTTTTTTYPARSPCNPGDTLSGTTCTHTTATSSTYAATPTCISPTVYSSSANKCQADPTCNTVSGYVYVNGRDRCEKASNGSCAATYDSATGYCTNPLTCPGSGTQDANNGLLCFLNPTVSCPSGMATGQVNGSTVTCQQPSTCPTSPLISSLDTTIGKCKIRGTDLCPTTWGFAAATDACTHTPVCNGATYDKTAKKCCACASANGCIATAAAPTVSDYFCSPNTCVDITAPGAQIGAGADMTFLQNDVGFSPQNGSCAGSIYVFGGQPKTCRPQGWDTLGKDCCSDLSAALWLVGGICASDTPVGKPEVARLTHYIGDYCSNSWPLVGCVQMTKAYCYFDTVLSRIINEQARLQLKRFNAAYCPNWPGGPCPPAGTPPHGLNPYWGTATTPDCTGLRPEELQMLDWSKIDLGEYFTDLQNQVAQQIPAIQNSIQQNINNFYNQLK